MRATASRRSCRAGPGGPWRLVRRSLAHFDEQIYSFIGWRILSGELPFVDWWDRKPFGAPSRFTYPDHLINVRKTGAIGVSQTKEVARILSTGPGVIVTTSTPTQVQSLERLLLVGEAIRMGYEPLATV